MISTRTAHLLIGGLALATSGHADEPVFVYVGAPGVRRPVPVLVDALPESGRHVREVAIPPGLLPSSMALGLVAWTRRGVALAVVPGDLDAYLHGGAESGHLEIELAHDGVRLLAPEALSRAYANAGNGTSSPPPPLGGELGKESRGNGAFPPTGSEGTMVTLSEDLSAYAGSYDVDDVLFLGQGHGGWFGTVDLLEADRLRAEIDHVPPLAKTKKVTLRFGAGETRTIPDYQGIHYDVAHRWRGGSSYQEHVSVAKFGPKDGRLFLECTEPDPYVNVKGRLENGALRFRLPGAGTCEGDQFSFRIAMLRSDGERVYVSLKDTTGAPKAPWSISNLIVLWPLNNLMVAAGFDLEATYESNEIVISGATGSGLTIVGFHPESFIRIRFDMSRHALFEELGGLMDGYQNGPDPATPSTAFWNAYVQSITTGELRDYDVDTCDDATADTLAAFGGGSLDGPVRSGKLGMRIRGYSCNTDTDSIGVGWNGLPYGSGGAMDWGISLNALDTELDTNGVWSPGEDVFLCLDLSALPLPGGSSRDILDRVREDVLDVFVVDDTTVDFFWIRALRCVE